MNELELFAAAIAVVDSTERAALLDRECLGQESRQRLDRLIDAHFQAHDLLDPPSDDARTGAFFPSDAVGTIIAGRYKLLQKLGEGGMGAVWMADQTDPVKRRVAVKLIRAERGQSKAILSRFEAERQAIALMDHPHIAKLLDAGTTETGSPYFVMELVKGVPLTEFCDVHKLSIPDRLKLFVQVCGAVRHAHQKGIIHRDLKPTNILVESHDGQPVPKVIDFGLAKATTGMQLTEHTLFTAFGSVLGTPLYMAPEQANFNALDVDTRADVYALGTILYELLTGTTPLSREALKKAALDEMLKLIREQEAPTPSSQLSSSDSAPSVAANRNSEPTKLGRLIQGELDWIVLKALNKERDRRYETASGLAADVERYLAGEPVLAHPPSRAYRVKKFVCRYRPQVMAASLVMLALLAGIAGTTFGLVRATRSAQSERLAKLDAEQQKESAIRAAEREAKERTKAQAKEAEANSVVKFFEDRVFIAAQPKGFDGGLGSDVKLKDAITASLPSLDADFADQPLVEARLRQTLSKTFYFLGETTKAVEQNERARDLYLRHCGIEHFETLRSMINLANGYQALGRQNEALRLREETLAIQKRVLGSDHLYTLMSMNNLANSYEALNRHADALELRQQTLEIQRRALAPNHPDTLLSMINLANSYFHLNRHAEAVKLLKESLAIQQRTLPADHPDTLASMFSLANNYQALGLDAEALALNEETLATRRRILPADHPDILVSMGNLANSYELLNRHAEALKLREESLAVQKRVLPPDHLDVLITMNNLATSYYNLKRHAEALKLYEETLAIQKRVLPPHHSRALTTMYGLALTLLELDRNTEAIAIVDEIVAKATGETINPNLIPSALALRIQYFMKVLDPAGCRSTAEMWEKLDRRDAESLYNAACFRSLTAAVQARAETPDAARLAQEDADRAMAWLMKSVAAGWTDASLMKQQPDFDYLRNRSDFKKLLVDLETRFPATREPASNRPSEKK